MTATVEDQYGNPVLGNSSSVTLTASGPGTALYGTDSMTAVNGVAAFTAASDVNLHNAGNGYTLTATAAVPGGTLIAISNSFNVIPGTADHLAFTTQPAAVIPGTETITAAVTVEDKYNNPVTTDNANVTISLNRPAGTYKGDTNGQLNGAASFVNANGVTTFSSLSIRQPNTGYSAAGSGYTLTATDTTDGISVTSASFATTLVVTGVTMTTTGFQATFSEPVDPAQVNLYGAQSLPSVTLTGEYMAGQVNGSLVLDSTTAYIATSAASATESGTTVTITTKQANNFTPGDVVTISGVTSPHPGNPSDPAAAYNGTFVITSASGSTFTYTDVSGLPNSSSGGAAVQTDNKMTFVATTLVNGTGLPIAGASTPVTGVAASGVLYPDTYLVDFASGSTAFTTLGGQALDGPHSSGFGAPETDANYGPAYGPFNAPLTVGPADYTANEAVFGGATATTSTPVNDVAVVVPAFARGPGNAVNLPNSTGPIATLTDNGGTVTVHTLVQDQATVGQRVSITNAGAYNGTYTILTNTSRFKPYFDSTFTFAFTGTNPGVVSGGSFSILTGIPISLSDTANVSQATFTLTYNPALLNIASTTNTVDPGLVGSGATFTVTANNSTGVATIVFNDAAGLPGYGGGPIVLGSLSATVPGTAVDAYAAKDLLNISVNSISGTDLSGHALIPGVTAIGSQAVHVVAYLGDATGDGTLDSSDVVQIESVYGDVTDGFGAYRLADPAIVGGISGDGFVSTTDGVDLINYVNGGNGSNAHTVVFFPPFPSGLGTIVSTGPDPTLSIPSAMQVGADGSLAVPVNIDDPLPAANAGMTEATVAVSYAPAVFSVSPSDIHLGSVPASGSGWSLQSTVDQASGQIAVTIWSATPIASSAAGSLVTIDFHQSGLAVAGTTTIDLVDSVDPNGGAAIHTQVDGAQGPYTLTPAPTSAYNSQIDGLVTLAAAEGATGSASAPAAPPQLTASVVAGPAAPASAAAAADGLFTALARGDVDAAELANLDGGDQAVRQALAAQRSAAGFAQTNLDRHLWEGEDSSWLDGKRERLS